MPGTLEEYTHLCSELVTFVVTGTNGKTEIGNLEEIGERNARILAERPVATGAEIELMAGNHQLTGVVSAWSYDPVLGYFIDVTLNTDSRWSPEWFEPQHLFGVHQGDSVELEIAAA